MTTILATTIILAIAVMAFTAYRAVRWAEQLRRAVAKVYYAAHWTPDRHCDADKLWAELRNAAGMPEGNAPKNRR